MSLWSCELGAGHTYDIVIDWRRAMALLQSGQVGDVNEIRYGMTILYQAVVHRKLAAIEALLRHGADINLGRQARSSHFEVVAAMTPLMCAAINGHDDCIAALVRGGADVNYCTPADGTFGPCNALQRAVSGGDFLSLRTTKMLLALGADPNLCGNYALFTAIEGGYAQPKMKPEIVAVLLKAGADVNAVRYDVETPLGVAQDVVESPGSTVSEIDCARRRVVGTLLRAGATIQPSHAADPTPADLADFEFKDDDDDLLRIAYAQELSMYLRAVLAAGGFEKYGRARRAPFVAMLDRGLSLPRDAISVICEFWLRVDEYDQHTNLL